ncbi:MAG: hypothetical protein KDA52_24025, partial [Planctomycetaceae bacterium]|nr:hypothetical protein [Planctomycetaceae bacterium]
MVEDQNATSGDAGQSPPDKGRGKGAGAREEGGKNPNFQWYVLKVQSNRERTIRDSLLKRIRREGLSDYFGEIVIPTEKVVET